MNFIKCTVPYIKNVSNESFISDSGHVPIFCNKNLFRNLMKLNLTYLVQTFNITFYWSVHDLGDETCRKMDLASPVCIHFMHQVQRKHYHHKKHCFSTLVPSFLVCEAKWAGCSINSVTPMYNDSWHFWLILFFLCLSPPPPPTHPPKCSFHLAFGYIMFFLSPSLYSSWRHRPPLLVGGFKTFFWQLVRLLGWRVGLPQGLYLHRTTQCRKMRTNIRTSSGIWTHDPSVQVVKTHASDCAAIVINRYIMLG
jgi:hypothetical protein